MGEYGSGVLRRSPADVRLPCMVYAAVGRLPSAVTPDIERSIVEARKSPGVVRVFCPGPASEAPASARLEVAVVARGYWLARQLLARLLDRCGGPGTAATGGDTPDPACGSRVTRATAHFVDGRLRLWMATGEMEITRALAASLSGVPEEYVDLRVTGAAEGATCRDALTAALSLARELQPAPVQVILTGTAVVPLPVAGIPAALPAEPVTQSAAQPAPQALAA